MNSFRDRISARKTRLGGGKSVAALGSLAAFATQAQALILTTVPGTETTSAYWSFDPLEGTYVKAYNASMSVLVAQCGSAVAFADFSTTNIFRVGTSASDINIAAGTIVGPDSDYFDEDGSTGWGVYGPPPADTMLYVGFQLINQGPELNLTYYGWAEYQYLSGSAPNMKLERFAVGDPGEAVTVGAVPEPATTALALGALALVGIVWKRWRRS